MGFELRELTAQELEEWTLRFTGQDKARRGAFRQTPQCLCGRFARFVRYEANTLPHGESVLTVDCARCGEVRIR